MSTVLAQRVHAPELTAAGKPRAAFVVEDAARASATVALLRHALDRWAGTVVECGVEAAGAGAPDAIVLAIGRDVAAGVASLRRIRREVPTARVVVAARDDGNAGIARQALNAGADAFVALDTADDALAPAIDAVLAGLVCVPRSARRVIAKPTFSHREKEVLGLLVAGLTNRQ